MEASTVQHRLIPTCVLLSGHWTAVLCCLAVLAPVALLFRYPMRLPFANFATRRLSVAVGTSILPPIEHWAILVTVELLYYLTSEPIWTTALLVALVALLSRGSSSDRHLATAAAVGAIIRLAIFPFIHGLRLELFLLLAAALGAAALARDVVARLRPAIAGQPSTAETGSVT
jgi:hypothetical protein